MNIKKISLEQLRHAINLRDLSNPADGSHSMQILMDDIVHALKGSWKCQVKIYRENPIVSIEDNYDRLNYPKDGASRDARYTRYVCDTALLRTQSSAMVPNAMQEVSPNLPDDILLAMPGLTYRRDCVDRIHSAEPHHLDLWRLKKESQLNNDDLMNMIDICMGSAIPGIKWRVIPSPHPYTQNGVQIDALWNDKWIEVGECGLAHPQIIKENINSYEGMSGLAMGLGLDRLLMVRKNIPDIRLLRSNDLRISSQMQDLGIYKPVSLMPPVTRDLSIVLDNDMTDDDIGDIVRESLQEHAEIVELVETLSQTPYQELPEAAKKRLGISPSQKNILLRVVLRALDRTLTTEECNEYRDQIYAALHKGTEWHWASHDRQNKES
jgi:phenylalanyl-tRNA synthetase alpha chain